MKMFTLGIVLGAVAYLNIGYRWGRFSWKVWHETGRKTLRKERRSIAGFLCFPVSHQLDQIGHENNNSWTQTQVAQCDNVDRYANEMAFMWPLKFVFNLGAIICSSAWFVAKNTFTLVTNPLSLLPKKKPPKELPEAKALPPKRP